MASEDNFLRLDMNNYDDEIIFQIVNGNLNLFDIEDFYNQGYISKDQYELYNEYCMEELLNGK